MDPDAADVYLVAHSNYDATGRIISPTTTRIERLMELMGEPQRAARPSTSPARTARARPRRSCTRLLVAQGLTVGTFTSPHLERVNERIDRNGEPISDEELAEQISAIADLEVLAGVQPSYFEIVTAAAFRWFADVAVDVVVIEVGLLGRWDATNVVDGQVAVVTNVGARPPRVRRPDAAPTWPPRRPGIVKPGSTLVLGETDPELVAIFRADGAGGSWSGACRLRRGREPARPRRAPARAAHPDVDATTSCTCRSTAGTRATTRRSRSPRPRLLRRRRSTQDVVEEAFAAVRMPGRFEVLGHQPLVIVDGAHNPPGADTCASVLFEDFDPVGERILVVGCLAGREPEAMLEALRARRGGRGDLLHRRAPPGHPRRRGGERPRRAIGCDDVVVHRRRRRRVRRRAGPAGADDLVLVTGSLYVVRRAPAPTCSPASRDGSVARRYG